MKKGAQNGDNEAKNGMLTGEYEAYNESKRVVNEWQTSQFEWYSSDKRVGTSGITPGCMTWPGLEGKRVKKMLQLLKFRVFQWPNISTFVLKLSRRFLAIEAGSYILSI